MKLQTSMLVDLFCTCLGTKYANFQQKFIVKISGQSVQTFHCGNITTMKCWIVFSRNLLDDFLLKIGILSAKVYSKKNVP